jgi:transposase-like protein
VSPPKRNLPPLDKLQPSAAADRWVPSRKAALIEAVCSGAISLEEACHRHRLSPEEFASWLAAFEKHGVPGLRATRFQIYREKPSSPHKDDAPTAERPLFI